MKKNEIKIGAILSYVIIVANMVIGICYTPILTKNLGQSEYGLYSLVTTIISYLTVLDFGFGNAIIIYTAKYRVKNEKEKQSKLYGMFFIIYMVISIVTFLLGVIITIKADYIFKNSMTSSEINKARILLGILTINLAVTFPLSIFSSIITAYEKFVFLKIVNLIRITLNPIIMTILLKFGFKSVALVILTTVLNLVTLLLDYIFCKKRLKIKLIFEKFDIKLLKEIFAYSIWIFLNTIMDKINWSLDQFILGTMCGTVVVAIYSVASQLNQMYLNFSTAITGVMLPKISKMQEEGASDKEFTDIFVKTGRIQFIILFLILSGFVLYGREFINIMWLGKEYDGAYIISVILMVPLIIPLIQNIGLNIIQAKNQYKFRVITLLVFAVFNIGISVILAKFYNGIGAAIGTSLSIIFGQIIFMNIFYYKKTKIDIPLFWKNIFKMFIPLLFVMMIGYLGKNIFKILNVKILILEIIVYAIIYIIFSYKFVVNEYEKELIDKPINKLLRREK